MRELPVVRFYPPRLAGRTRQLVTGLISRVSGRCERYSRHQLFYLFMTFWYNLVMLKGLVKRLLLPANPSAIILLGFYTMLWGFWLINPWWDVFTSADLFSKMNELAPEWLWGLTAMLTGATIVYGAVSPSYKTLQIGAVVGGWHWGMSSVMYFMGNWQTTGGITSLFISLYSIFIYINIRANRDFIEEEYS